MTQSFNLFLLLLLLLLSSGIFGTNFYPFAELFNKYLSSDMCELFEIDYISGFLLLIYK